MTAVAAIVSGVILFGAIYWLLWVFDACAIEKLLAPKFPCARCKQCVDGNMCSTCYDGVSGEPRHCLDVRGSWRCARSAKEKEER